MGDQGRKLKNPLLTAAGQGFPFDDYGGSNFFMPVTPAVQSPESIQPVQYDRRDEGELPASFQPAILQPSVVEHNIQCEATAEVACDIKPLPIDSQQSRAGYFTSILSSLPNLSLTSLTGQQTIGSVSLNESIEDRLSVNNPASYLPPGQEYNQATISSANLNDQSRPPASSSTSSFPSLLHQQPAPPPPPPTSTTCPPPSSGSVSYRLGNQRRLKYAPPPALTSSTANKPLAPANIGISNPPNQLQPGDFFNPTAYGLRGVIDENPGLSAPVAFTQTNNPLTSAISLPETIPANNALKEPVTPHNTPANYFTVPPAFDTNYRSLQQQSINDLSQLPAIIPSVSETIGKEAGILSSPTPPPIIDLSGPTSVTANSEGLTEIDLSQREIPQESIPPEGQSVQTSELPAAHYFSTNFSHANSEPSLNTFFHSKNVEPIKFSQSAQLSSEISFCNSVGFELKPANEQNLSRQCEINAQSAISSGFISQTANGSSSTTINWSTPPATLIANEMPEPTGKATLNPIQTSINPSAVRNTQQADTIPPSLHNLAAGGGLTVVDKKMPYRLVYHHWFYRRNVENKILWNPFSMQDSLNLEGVYNSSDITAETKVPTDGGRYDVEILKRQRIPVYWSGGPTEVRRSSWFYKGSTESRYTPYEESTAARLEEEYKQACATDRWNRKVELSNGEYIIFHSATIQIHYLQATSPELVASWGSSAGTDNNGTYLQGASSRPKVVKRGVDEFHIEEGEPEKIDHLLFLVHGIGSVCDLKFRSVEEVVDEFRSISLQLIQSHYRTASTHGIVNRIEVLPISWHATLHSDDTGIDKKLKAITLESIPKLRHFTNDTLLDILFYTSPTYCQTIMQTVGNEMNRLYALFRERNADFTGNVCLGGHSLGSLILFDLLCHQKCPADEVKVDSEATIDEEEEEENCDGESSETATESKIKPMPRSILKRRLSRKISYVMGTAGTGQPYIIYPHLNFSPKAFFALGSPIGMFVTVRGIDKLGENFKLPTCPAFFNIFHPFDPVAYRIESLINSEASKYRPMLIPHHKGRKRMHLELKETMARVGADLKQKLLDSVRSTWNSVYQLAMFHRQDNHALEQEIDKVVEEQLQKSSNNSHTIDQEHDDDRENEKGVNLKVGQLNGGRRIDYVLQEAPFEYINEYIFALTSHVCYWESEDTMLLILKEMYGASGIQSDAQLPPQTMSIERPTPTSPSFVLSPGPSVSSVPNSATTAPQMGVDPTAPMSNKPIGPPPTFGFVRKL